MRLRLKFRRLAIVGLLALPAGCGRSGNRTVYVDVPTAGHLKEGSPVKFGSIDIGRLRRLTLLHSGVRLELLIERSDAPLQYDDLVAVRPVGVFGYETVVIVPGKGNERPLRDGDSLHAAAPEPPSPFREAFARAAMQQLSEDLHLHLVDSTKGAGPAPQPPRP